MADAASHLAASLAALEALAADAAALATLGRMAALTAEALAAGGKLLIAGNGGSAADAQHLAAEFVVRLVDDRAPLPALALTTDSSILTACGNDYGFETVFARQVEALGRPGDALLALSTSGNSRNLVLAAEAARARGMITLGLAGAAGGEMLACYDHVFRAPAPQAQIVQQLHVAAAHAVLAAVERALFPRGALA